MKILEKNKQHVETKLMNI